MMLGRVSGVVWCSQQAPELVGLRFAVVAEEAENGRSVVAADLIGAGLGDRVMCVSGGAATKAAGAPVDMAIVGLVDSGARSTA